MIMLIFYSTRCSLPSFLLPSTPFSRYVFFNNLFNFTYDYLQIDYTYDWAKLQQRQRRERWMGDSRRMICVLSPKCVFFCFCFCSTHQRTEGHQRMDARTYRNPWQRSHITTRVTAPLIRNDNVRWFFGDWVQGHDGWGARDASRALVGTWFLFFIFSLLIFFSCNLVLWQQLGRQQRQQPRQRQWWGLR